MAKKSNRNQPVREASAGPNPYEKNNSTARNLGKALGAACLVVFILFDEFWISLLACGICLAAIYGIQGFHDKTVKGFASFYLYATLAVLGLAYAEYSNGFLTKLMTLK